MRSLAIACLLAGCASYDGRGLVAGQSRTTDVEALMGPPAEKISTAGGESIWYYPRNPAAPHTFAVRMGPDGLMRSIDQTLTLQNLYRVRTGVTTEREARELLGPPWRVSHNARMQGDVWDYRMLNDAGDLHNMSLQFSSSGVVSQVYLLKELVNEPCGM